MIQPIKTPDAAKCKSIETRFKFTPSTFGFLRVWFVCWFQTKTLPLLFNWVALLVLHILSEKLALLTHSIHKTHVFSWKKTKIHIHKIFTIQCMYTYTRSEFMDTIYPIEGLKPLTGSHTNILPHLRKTRTANSCPQKNGFTRKPRRESKQNCLCSAPTWRKVYI